MLLMIDNYDSFTWNLVHYLAELGQKVEVMRNDEVALEQIAQMSPAYIVVSPGPCTPDQSGISLALIDRFCGQIPILGVCLGHQSIAQSFGGKIVRAATIMHGKTSEIYHRGVDIFTDLPNPFTATRYHSLIIDKQSLPDCLEVTAWTENEHGEMEVIMGIRHRQENIFGVQFHPESVLSSHGHVLLGNFLKQNSVTGMAV